MQRTDKEIVDKIPASRRKNTQHPDKKPTVVTRLLTDPEATEKLRLADKTLRSWRAKRNHPELPWLKVGRRVMYDERDVQAFIDSCRVRS